MELAGREGLKPHRHRTDTNCDSGLSIDRDERNDGMRCIAVPVFDAKDEAVAGISVSGPAHRMKDDVLVQLSAHVRDAAQALTLAIGGKVTPPAVLSH